MRGARHFRPDVPTRLKKCSEHIGDDCTLCCAVTPCAYCLELEIYGEPIKHGYAPESADHWTGTVDGHSFDAFWERNQYTDQCEFVVELDSVEVYRKSCYEGQECRDSSDETGVTIGYDDATLRWIKHEPLELPHIIGDAGCPTWFCGECECSCECVCVTITEPDSTVITGELCNVAYECEGPRWEGQIGYYDLALALGRDSYGNCVLESTVNGEAQDAVSVTGCKDMSATITLYDGTTIEVSCKICSCDEIPCVISCCPGTSAFESTFNNSEVGPGELGCPDYPRQVPGTIGDVGFSLTICTPPPEITSVVNYKICEAFCTNTTYSIPGSVGSFDFEAVFLCSGDGSEGKAFIKYHISAPPGIPLLTWIEVPGGMECPECGEGDSGLSKPMTLWHDVYVTCSQCNANEIDMDGFCTGQVLYSVRFYYTSGATCQ